MFIYNVRLADLYCKSTSILTGLFAYAGGAFMLNHVLNHRKTCGKIRTHALLEKYKHIYTRTHAQWERDSCMPRCAEFVRGICTHDDTCSCSRTHDACTQQARVINRPWRWRVWSSLARRRRVSTENTSIVKCAGDPCADSRRACVAPRRSSGRSTASAMPPSRPASDSTRTPSTSLKQMASVRHRLVSVILLTKPRHRSVTTHGNFSENSLVGLIVVLRL